jgi:hypothetical protein
MKDRMFGNYNKRSKSIPELSIVFECQFTDPLLNVVVTLPEAAIMYQKSKPEVHRAIDSERIVARKSFSGGAWLITLHSLKQCWGEPIVPVMDALFTSDDEGGNDDQQ